MSRQVTAGEFANRPRAESTESTESFQPHFFGGRAISENECRGNYTSSIAQAAKTFRTFRTFRSAAGSTKRYMLREPDHAVLEAQLCGCAR